MKIPTMLIQALLHQASVDLDLATKRDSEVIQSRIEHEGLSFLTLTLPILCDALEQGIENGFLTCPTNFSRHGSLPRLLGGFFRNVFDGKGVLLPTPCVQSIFWIRQICRFFKKPKINCTPEKEQAAIARYKEVEEELFHATASIGVQDSYLDKVASILWSQVFSLLDPSDIICGHGPGVTADRRLSNERHDFRQWYSRAELEYPSDLHAFHSVWESAGFGYSAGCAGLDYIELKDEPPVRVVFVPKTLAAPRVIAIEPSPMQFIQQGLLNYIVPRLESHPLTRKSLHFSDQRVNQCLALISSKTKRFATLDLKDASDRVHFMLVRRIFKSSGILDHLESARSLHADLPDGSNVILNKFASMGSAICFPVEAMVFYTIVMSAIHRHHGILPTTATIKRFSSMVCIFGDDLIVPVECVAAITEDLEKYALRINRTKSFQNSQFRESCGGDYFNGESVKPVYAREVIPSSYRDWGANHVMAWTSTSNQFYLNGHWHMSQVIRDVLCKVLRTDIPRSREIGSGVYFLSLFFNTHLKYNSDLYCTTQRRIHYIPLKVKDTIDGNATALFNKHFRRIAETPPDEGGVQMSVSWVDQRTIASRMASSLNLDEVRREIPIMSSVKTDDIIRGLQAHDSRSRVFGHMGPKIASEESDAIQSVKRGVFKSKHQWVTLST